MRTCNYLKFADIPKINRLSKLLVSSSINGNQSSAVHWWKFVAPINPLSQSAPNDENLCVAHMGINYRAVYLLIFFIRLRESRWVFLVVACFSHPFVKRNYLDLTRENIAAFTQTQFRLWLEQAEKRIEQGPPVSRLRRLWHRSWCYRVDVWNGGLGSIWRPPPACGYVKLKNR